LLVKVEEHLGGKTHLAGIKQIQHSLQIISVGNFYQLFNSLFLLYVETEVPPRAPDSVFVSNLVFFLEGTEARDVFYHSVIGKRINFFLNLNWSYLA
jgi:hypothetical protein